MSRPLRIEFAGALHHVMARGTARAPTVLYLPDAQHSRVQAFPAYGEALRAFFKDGCEQSTRKQS